MSSFPGFNDESRFLPIYNDYLLEENPEENSSFNEFINPVPYFPFFIEDIEERPEAVINNSVKFKVVKKNIEDIEERPEAVINNSVKFKVVKKKNHGRTSKKFLGKKKKHMHMSTDKDNIICKIQIGFFKFLVNFANDAIKTEFNKKESKSLEFKHIMHKIKNQISKKSLNYLIKKPISVILQMDISKKYKKLSLKEDYNKSIYNKVIALSDWLKNLFNMNYLDAFKLYYNDCKSSDSFEFENKIIKFTKEKTKSFFCLYNKAGTEEKKSRIKHIAENYYLNLGKAKSFKVELCTEQ